MSTTNINVVAIPNMSDYLPEITPSKAGNLQAPSTGNIKVLCRFRPLNDKEKNISQELCVDFLDNQTCSIKSTVT